MSLHLINNFVGDNEPTEFDIANAKFHADGGNSEAQYHLALMYDAGKGVERNPREAEKLYKMAALQGHAAAQYYLAKLYSTQNSGIRRDEKEAAKWFKAAEDQGFKG